MKSPEALLADMQNVSLKDRSLFMRHCTNFPSEICELTFTNMFLWAESRQVRWCKYNDHLLFSFMKHGAPRSWYQPMGPHPERIIRESLEEQLHFLWEDIGEPVARTLHEKDKRFRRDRCDYVYLKQDIIDLPGEKFAHKRNYIRRCEKLYHPTIIKLGSHSKVDILALFDRWQADKKYDQIDQGVLDERKALELAFDHFEELELHGIGVQIAGELQAFAIGVPLNPTMVSQSFEKAIFSFKGLFQYTFHAFAQSLPKNILYINKEEDAGIEGLRLAKEDWHPHHLVNKYSISNVAFPTL